MILSLSTVTIDIGKAQYPQRPNFELIQASTRSASGVTYVEDFSVELNTFTYRFVDMRYGNYINLMSFFINVAEGKLNTFSLTDDYNTTRIVRFTSSRISFSESSLNLWNGSFTVEEVS